MGHSHTDSLTYINRYVLMSYPRQSNTRPIALKSRFSTIKLIVKTKHFPTVLKMAATKDDGLFSSVVGLYFKLIGLSSLSDSFRKLKVFVRIDHVILRY